MTPLALADKMAFLTTGVWDQMWLDTGRAVESGWYSCRTDLYNATNDAWSVAFDVADSISGAQRHSI